MHCVCIEGEHSISFPVSGVCSWCCFIGKIVFRRDVEKF